MSRRPSPTLLAAAAFLAASLGDPAAFAQTIIPLPPPPIPLPQAFRTPAALPPSPVKTAGEPAAGILSSNPGAKAFNDASDLNTIRPVAPKSAGLIDYTKTSVALEILVRDAAASAKSAPGYDRLSAAQKTAAVQAAIAAALARSGVSADLMAGAVTGAVGANILTVDEAVALAQMVSPDVGSRVGGALFNRIEKPFTKNVITTSALGDTPSISVLSRLSGVVAVPTLTPPAAYDPCAGVIAAYCG